MINFPKFLKQFFPILIPAWLVTTTEYETKAGLLFTAFFRNTCAHEET